METLFETPLQSVGQNPVIALIDASGSTTTPFNTEQTINVKMEAILREIPADRFRVIFWNSDYPEPTNNRNFPNGVMRIMHVIEKSAIKSLFSYARSLIRGNCFTYPHLGFRNIPDDWINDTSPTHIYFITDGQMGPDQSRRITDLKQELRTAIEHLFTRHNNVHLHLITVEAQNYDFGRVETLQVAAGGDVFEVIQRHQLTRFITEFKSFTPNHPDGYHHINTVIPPAGYVPFIDRYFSEAKTSQFIQYLNTLIHSTQNEDELLKIVQNLSSTLRVLTKDKPRQLVDSIVRTFCDLFKETVIDPTMVQFILADSILLEQQGRALVFAQYRARLRDLYRQAQSFLEQSTKTAVGLRHEFMTLPVADKIVYGNQLLVSDPIQLGKTNFPNAAIKVNKLTLPVIPLLTTSQLSPINEQCIRQFVRAIIANQYHVDQMGDMVIYLVMALALRVVKSPIDDRFKTAFRQLVYVMLRKKRLNTDVTEIERLEGGELPTPNNGKIETFYGYMDQIARILGLSCQPMSVWYILCATLDNPLLLTKQLIHCTEAINHDFAGVDPKNILDLVQVTPIQTGEKSLTDYTCIITLNDCSTEGGFLFAPHTSPTGVHCEPIYVVSRRGRDGMLEQPRILCPVCYQELTRESFRPIGPKTSDDATIFPDETLNPFAQVFVPRNASPPVQQRTQPDQQSTQPETSKTRKILVLMKGTVGSGKTTYATALREAVEAVGGHCVSEGTDQYCVNGHSIQDACQMVTTQLRSVFSVTNPLKVVIIDTCGDRNNGSNVFGVNFQGWKMITVQPNYTREKQREYMAWSLRNVLQRPRPSQDSKYYLNPVTAGVQTCVSVHRKKGEAIFGRGSVPNFSGQTIETVVNNLNHDADEYARYLEHSMTMASQVETVIRQITP
jgi:hypothetical protein